MRQLIQIIKASVQLNSKRILKKNTMQIAIIFSCLAFAVDVRCESAVEIKKTENEVREQMIKISAELGVTCTECHMVTNFKDSSKESYRVAIQHLKIVQALKENGFNGQKGQPEANCFLCHRGELKFNYKPPTLEKK